MYKHFLFILPFVFSFLTAKSNSSKPFVKDIKIYGNNRTKDYIINREIKHSSNAIYDSLLSIDDRNRLYNLNIFSSVEISVIDSTYTIQLRESPRILPLPLFSYDEQKGIGYGAAIQNTNLFGRNYKLFVGGMAGATDIYVIRYINPWAFGNHVSLSFDLYRDKWENEIHKYISTTNGIEIESGFYIGLNNKFRLRFGYNNVLINDKRKDVEISSNYDFFISLIDYQFDTRDIYNDPTKGSLLWIEHELGYEFNEYNKSYTDITVSYEKNYKVHDYRTLVFSYKILGSFYISETEHIHNIKYLGGEEFVRGYSIDPEYNYLQDYKFYGYNLLSGSISLQGTIIKKKDYDGIELGLDGVVFADCGSIGERARNISMRNAILGFGFGAKIFVSSVGFLGIYIGFNPNGQSFAHLRDSNS